MDPLLPVITSLKQASQTLWDYRKNPFTSEAAFNYLESAQAAMSQLLEHLEECREILKKHSH